MTGREDVTPDGNTWIEDDGLEIEDLTGAIPPGPGSVEEPSAAVTTEPQSAPDDPQIDELPEAFDERYREDFEGLLYLGKLQHSFTWLGHRFTIRTLTTDEIVEVGQIHREYAPSIADAKVYQGAVVAACVVELDGMPLRVPIDQSEDELILKFRYVMKNWFPPVLDVIYSKYLQLEARATDILIQMGKARGEAVSMFTSVVTSGSPTLADS